ncbi:MULTISPECIES: hypothetical protein [Pseudomonas syringae group]|uniref:hypothetical protein n=1 Tax=Pseudomonas syringae group TaxID=136849 RepID=UPI000F005D53|nr:MULTISPECIES: hypothetical protein [Pseudomonas syringae group]MDH4602443.1 hypothetical protein [Pseudomonas syringae pv. papulans]
MTNRAPNDLIVHIARYQLRVVAPSGNHPDAVRRRKLIEEMKYQEEAGTHLEWVMQALLEKANSRCGDPGASAEASKTLANDSALLGHSSVAGTESPQAGEVIDNSKRQTPDDRLNDSDHNAALQALTQPKASSQMPKGLSVM